MKLKDKLKRFVSPTTPVADSESMPEALVDPDQQVSEWGGQVRNGKRGSYYYIEKRYSLDWVHGGSVEATADGGGRALGHCSGSMGQALAFLAQDPDLVDGALEDMLFLDTETTGLAMGTGTLPFLIGLGRIDGDAFVVEQYLMRDFPEEAAVLETLADRIHAAKGIISFNGKRFDWPLLKDRFMMQRVPLQTKGLLHLDLLYPARRLWRYRFPSCSLGMLESEVLGFVREGDVSGAEVPQRYFSFLKEGDPQHLTAVLRHNLWDILSLNTLTVHLSERARWSQGEMNGTLHHGQPGLVYELEGMARIHARNRSWNEAVNLSEWALNLDPDTEVHFRLLQLLAQGYKKLGLRKASIMVYDTIRDKWPDDLLAWEEAAKYHEHYTKQGIQALQAAQEGLLRAQVQRNRAMETRFVKRVQRLRSRQQRGGTLDFGAPGSAEQ